jgi:hypothetical protein
VPLRIVRGLVKLLRLEDVGKEGGGGKINNSKAMNDFERGKQNNPIIRPLISFLLRVVVTEVSPERFGRRDNKQVTSQLVLPCL